MSDSRSISLLIQDAIRKYWHQYALSDMGGINLQYRDVAESIEKLHILFQAAGLRPGDKIAICGKNSANWVVTFLACLTGGFVAVPLLHEFKADTVRHLINHSDARLLFVDASIWEELDESTLPALVGAIYISEFGMPLSRCGELTEARNNLNAIFGTRHTYSYEPDDFRVRHDNPEDVALISYTSGSTGMSKGVMLPVRSLCSNVRFCLDNLDLLRPGDGMVNMLPLAHLYGMVIETLHPFCKGVHCNFLTRLPSPKIILKAFADIRPRLIITVPLILEKIIRNKVFPLIEKPWMKMLLKVPYVDDRLLDKIRREVVNAFGGNLVELIVGGAPLNPDVEKFLRRIGFPFTVGYGMTECGPLLTYAPWNETKEGSCGRCVSRMEMKIDSPNPASVPGNLYVKGDNVMLGYYKNSRATAEVLSGEGDDVWMNTGDMCLLSPDGFISICGRSKTMILGPSGQNIYPEEIEQKLNTLPYVVESLVIDDGGRLVALVYPDYELQQKQGLSSDDMAAVMDQNLHTLNDNLPSYSKVSRIKLMSQEFEKTPKRSIKRFLYQP